jgi:hypothetical protein
VSNKILFQQHQINKDIIIYLNLLFGVFVEPFSALNSEFAFANEFVQQLRFFEEFVIWISSTPSILNEFERIESNIVRELEGLK